MEAGLNILSFVSKHNLLLTNCIFQTTYVFQNYGPGVRYVRFTHGGKDTQFWAGWYGVRLTDSSVEVCPAEET